MPEMDDNDIIIKLAGIIKHSTSGGEATINYASTETIFHLPAGSVEKHLAAAADHAGMEVALKGATSASLRRKPGGAQLVRG